jgi:hypothetical protein
MLFTNTFMCREANHDGFLDCYFPLMAAVFGITDGQGMLFYAGQRPFEAETLLTFLRPEGTLFGTLMDIDAEGLHKCRLPTSHLAQHTQALLGTPAGNVPIPLIGLRRPFAALKRQGMLLVANNTLPIISCLACLLRITRSRPSPEAPVRRKPTTF